MIVYKTKRITIKIGCKFIIIKLSMIISIIIKKVKNSDVNFII